MTFAEYEEGFFRFADCLAAAGYVLEGVRLLPETELYDYLVPAPATDGGSEDICYEREFAGLDFAWQTGDVRSRPADPYGSAEDVLRQCLEEAGLTPPGGADAVELEDLVERNGLTVQGCVDAVLAGLSSG